MIGYTIWTTSREMPRRAHNALGDPPPTSRTLEALNQWTRGQPYGDAVEQFAGSTQHGQSWLPSGESEKSAVFLILNAFNR